MARNSENIAGAISAVNNIVSTQTEALAQIKTTLARKAAGAIDISLGITSAAVGDIVKVKAVDANGKPTEWEAAGLSGEGDWFKIGEYTWTAEDAAETNIPHIKFTQDSEGNPLALDAVFIRALPLTENNKTCAMGLICAVTNRNQNYFLWADAIQGGTNGNIVCTISAEVKKKDFPCEVEVRYAKSTNLNGGASAKMNVWSPKTETGWIYPLNAVEIFFQTQILEGSKFEFYGRKAT